MMQAGRKQGMAEQNRVLRDQLETNGMAMALLEADLYAAKEREKKLVGALQKLSLTNADNFAEIRTWKASLADPDAQDLDWYNHIASEALRKIGLT